MNKQFHDSLLDFETAFAKVKVIREQLYKERDIEKRKSVFNQVNLKILESYWESEYSHRSLVDEKSMYHDLKRAIECAGSLSLTVCTLTELQKEINRRFIGSPNKQRRVVTRLNQILKFLGRDFQLRKVKEEWNDVKYLTPEEMAEVTRNLKDENFATLCWLGLLTGLRIGEIFSLRPERVQQTYLRVVKQVDTTNKLRQLKNRKPKKTYLLQGSHEYLSKWFDLEQTTKDRLRTINHARILKAACVKAFPAMSQKHCVFHDLRHSYAIHLLGKGVPIAQVAQSLGNSISVCEKYYTGFILTDHGIELIDKLLKET